MKTSLNVILLAIAASAASFAISVPEIDPGSSATAVTMLAGAVLVIRARRTK